ncbi:MAG TPA: hypothetical protein VE547_01940 [Mycobacteriales bacterium]|nr:hypothetical protein [Mycobacteriales bacterium]
MVGWGTAPWVAAVEAWLAGVPGSDGRLLVHRETRPWSTVWTVGEDRWFKENCPSHRREATVHAAVAELAPDHVDAPVAVQPERGWLLTRDGGTTLLDSAPGGTRGVEVATLTALLRDYAALQRRTVGHRDELVAAGLPVADPRDAAELAAAQADRLASLPATDPRHLPAAQRDRVRAALPALAAAGRELAAGPVPAAFDQADLFPRNVFLPRPGGPYRFFDFADAVWAHPFGSLVMLVVECLHRWRIPAGDTVDCRDPRVRAVLDAYLGCWTDLAPLPELRRLAECALRIAPLHRSAAWLGILDDAAAAGDDAALARHGRTPWAWLEDVTRPVRLRG